MVFIYSSVGKNKNVCTLAECFIYFYEKTVNSSLKLGALII